MQPTLSLLASRAILRRRDLISKSAEFTPFSEMNAISRLFKFEG